MDFRIKEDGAKSSDIYPLQYIAQFSLGGAFFDSERLDPQQLTKISSSSKEQVVPLDNQRTTSLSSDVVADHFPDVTSQEEEVINTNVLNFPFHDSEPFFPQMLRFFVSLNDEHSPHFSTPQENVRT